MKIATLMLLLGGSSRTTTHAWSLLPPTPTPTTSSTKSGLLSRAQVFQQTAATAAAAALTVGGAWSAPATAAESTTTVTPPGGVTVQVIKQGDGPKPEIGELAAIRFAAYVSSTGNKIDDIFESPEPYYTRLGSGGLLKGVETTLPLMRLGDRWKLTIPGDLAFGSKGRPASAGKPRIPADAEIIFEVEMVGLPGKEPELIDLIGDD